MSTVMPINVTIKKEVVELSAHAREEIDELLSHFPADQKKSALLGALNVVQHDNKGFLTDELMESVADYLNLAKIEVYEVASFYSMYELKPVARNNVAICTNICCMLMGSQTIVDHVEKKLNIKIGERSPIAKIPFSAFNSQKSFISINPASFNKISDFLKTL